MAEVVEAQEGDLAQDVARAIVRLHFSDAQNEQMRELADKNNRGEFDGGGTRQAGELPAR